MSREIKLFIWFSLGFVIPFLLVPFVHSADEIDSWSFHLTGESKFVVTMSVDYNGAFNANNATASMFSSCTNVSYSGSSDWLTNLSTWLPVAGSQYGGRWFRWRMAAPSAGACGILPVNTSVSYFYTFDIYPKDGILPSVTLPPWENSDGDCLNNSIDPWPNSDVPFTYTILETASTCATCPESWALIECARSDGLTMRFQYGTPPSSSTEENPVILTFPYNALPKDGCDLASQFTGGLGISEDSGSGTFNVVSGFGSVPSLSGGSGSEGTDTDSDSLKKTVDNTAAIASNQQEIANLLSGIKDNITGLRSDNRVNGTVGSGSSESVSSDNSDLIDYMEGVRDQEATDSASGAASVQSWLDSYTYTPDPADEEIPADKIPGEIDHSGIWDTFINNNPVKQALDSTQFQVVSETCSMTANIYGHDYVISLCEWEDQIEMLGTILIGITSISSLIMVVKG